MSFRSPDEDPSSKESELMRTYTNEAFKECPQGTDYVSHLDSFFSSDEDPSFRESESKPDYTDGALEDYPQGADYDDVSYLGAYTLEPGHVHDQTEASNFWESPAHPGNSPEIPPPEPAQPADLATDVQVTEGAAAGPDGNAPGEELPFRCWACDWGFKRNQELIRHLQVHLPKRKCPINPCTYKWNRPAKIKTHILEVHGSELLPEVFQEILKPTLRGKAVVKFVDTLEFDPFWTRSEYRGSCLERIDVDSSVLEDNQQTVEDATG